jgi:putative hydrolase of the HAD superfamily
MIYLPNALLLDMDDTILDITGSADLCWQALTAECAPGLGVDAAQLCGAIMAQRAAFWSDRDLVEKWRLDVHGAMREIVAQVLKNLGIGSPTSAAEIAEAFRVQREQYLRAFPDAIESVARFKELGLRLALITNGATALQRSKIERFDLTPYFDAILVEGEYGYGKPDQRIYADALRLLDAQPEEAWMVGDHLEWDVAAAQQMGLYGIWIDTRGKGLPPSSPVCPDRIIRSLAELIPD